MQLSRMIAAYAKGWYDEVDKGAPDVQNKGLSACRTSPSFSRSTTPHSKVTDLPPAATAYLVSELEEEESTVASDRGPSPLETRPAPESFTMHEDPVPRTGSMRSARGQL